MDLKNKINYVFIDSCTQVDNCHKSRAGIHVPNGMKILDRCEALVNQAFRFKHTVVGTVDTNSYDSWKFKNSLQQPPTGKKAPKLQSHCVKGTNGWLKMNETYIKNCIFIPDYELKPEDLKTKILDRNFSAFYLEKEDYSLFSNPSCAQLLEHLTANKENQSHKFIIFGVATEYSVKEAALDVIAWGKNLKIPCSVAVVSDAVAPVHEEDGRTAVKEMKSAGVLFETSAQILADTFVAK